MIDKKLWYVLICIMSLGQIAIAEQNDQISSSYGTKSLVEVSDKLSSVKIPELNFSDKNGRMQNYPAIDKGTIKDVKDFFTRITDQVSYYVDQIDKDYSTFLSKSAQIADNSLDFQKRYREKTLEFRSVDFKAEELRTEIHEMIPDIYDALNSWKHSLGYLYNDENAKQEAIKSTQDYVNTLDTKFKRLQFYSKSISDELVLFDQSKQMHIQSKKLSDPATELALKVKEKAKAAAEAMIKENQAKESQNKIEQEAAAAKKAQKEAADAKQKKEEEKKQEAQLQILKAEREAIKFDKLIQRFNELRDSGQQVIKALGLLIADIKNNSDNYPAEFIRDADENIFPLIEQIGTDFHARIDDVNNLIDTMKKLDKEFDDLLTKVQPVTDFQKIREKIINILLQYQAKFKFVSNLFKIAERYRNELKTILDKLEEFRKINLEKSIEVNRKISKKSNQMGSEKQNIDLQKVENILELCNAIKMKKKR